MLLLLGMLPSTTEYQIAWKGRPRGLNSREASEVEGYEGTFKVLNDAD